MSSISTTLPSKFVSLFEVTKQHHFFCFPSEFLVPVFIERRRVRGMSSVNKLIQFSPAIRKGIAQVKRDVLGHVPQIQERTGYQFCKKQLTGVYLNQYYTDPIAKSARQVSYSWHNQKRSCEMIRRSLTDNITNFTGDTRIYDGIRRTPTGEASATETTRKRTAKEGIWC
jgi:hypothetical protein